MNNLLKLIISIISLPVLIPWYVAEKLFQHFLQPLILRRYHAGPAKKPVRRRRRLLAFPILLLALYLAHILYDLMHLRTATGATPGQSRLFLFLLYNDFAATLNTLLRPVNKILLYGQGGDISFGEVLVAMYLLVVPLIIITNFAYCLLTTNFTLRHAIRLRNAADKEVNIVGYSEDAQDDEIFLGLDLKADERPFYAKSTWLQGHIQVVGSPGSGKTESILQPLWYQHIRRNLPTLVLDGKGSAQTVDSFYTIATSLAQEHDIIYFNPADPDRSAMYNPLHHGSIEEIKNRILSSLNWANYGQENRARLEHYLSIILRAIRETKKGCHLYEILKYFESRSYVASQIERIRTENLKNNLALLLDNYAAFQKETAFFASLLWEICQADYAWLLETGKPELDLQDIFTNRKDCYISLPMASGDSAMSFLGRLIIGDIFASLRHLSTKAYAETHEVHFDGGLVIIKELAKFANDQIIDLLRIARQAGVCVCFTSHSLAEFENQDYRSGGSFHDQLAEHTNVLVSFNISGAGTLQALAERMAVSTRNGESHGVASSDAGTPASAATVPEVLKQLQVGQCVFFVRQPRLLKILKTGNFRFDAVMPYSRPEGETVYAHS